jgi:anti-sigma regulatory factor (Ser/Thr protein kinase)
LTPSPAGKRWGVSEVVPTFSIRVAADHEAVSRARREIARWVVAVGGVPVGLPDLELVIAELAANVVDHTASPWVRIDVELAGREAVVVVAGGCAVDAIPPVERWGRIPGSRRGHGLRIVRAVCSAVEIVGDDRESAIRCRLPLT